MAGVDSLSATRRIQQTTMIPALRLVLLFMGCLLSLPRAQNAVDIDHAPQVIGSRPFLRPFKHTSVHEEDV